MENLKRAFDSPDNEFSPIPFWFWNDELNQDEIIRQLRSFREKEVTGFVLHPRMGLPKSQPYLSDTFMDLVRMAVEEAESLGMSVILYDEGMYPSGAANGLVVKANPDYASRGLEMREYRCGEAADLLLELEPGDRVVSVQAVRKRSGGEIDLDSSRIVEAHGENKVSFQPPDDGEWSLLVFVDTFTKGTIRGIHEGQDDGEEDAPKAADLLNPEAMRTFIALTHEAYYRKLERFFGSTVIAMFTDEPDLLGRGHKKGLRPWTTGFMDVYAEAGGPETDLPALWFEAGERTAEIRTKFAMSVHRRLADTYYKPLYEWCERHGIALTGHPAASDDIGSLAWFHIPGQDVVWRFIAPEDGKAVEGVHSTMAKCASDSARHRGRRRNLNECFGVCGKESGWSLTADEMKWYLDWLFVRGTNMISPHAFYYSIRGIRRDERPPDVGPNNIWWPEYGRIARYIKRMCWLMTDSVNQTSLAVLAGPAFLPWKSVKPLYERQIEFNYLEAELLTSAAELSGDGILRIGRQGYKAILIEDTSLIGPEESEVLERFAALGGSIIVTDAEGGGLIQNLISGDGGERQVVWREEAARLPALTDKLLGADAILVPEASSIRISHVVKEGVDFYLIVNEGENAYKGSLRTNLIGAAELWNPWDGSIRRAESLQSPAGGLDIAFELGRRESLWLVIDTTQPVDDADFLSASGVEAIELADLSFGWQAEGEFGRHELPGLSSWTEWEGLEHYSGTVVYEKQFRLDAGSGNWESLRLDLGCAPELAKVWMNGREVGVKMWKPYAFVVPASMLPPGNEEHVLRVEITNSLANRYDGMRHPSGLMGPVKLYGLTASAEKTS